MTRVIGCLTAAASCVLSAAGPALGLTLTRGPYLGRPGDTSVAIVWNTDQPADSRVDYGLPGAVPTTVRSAAATVHHVVTIGDLASGAAYRYQVFSDETPLGPIATFTAPRGPAETAFTFAVIGDTATSSPEEKAVTDLIADQLVAGPVDLILHAGDVVYPSGQEGSYDDQFFVPMADVVRQTPVLATLGNHDVRSAGGEPLLTDFVMPGNGITPLPRFYALRQADALFVCLDVESSAFGGGSEQYAWLERTLAGAAEKWKFVFFHEPPYSASNPNRLVRMILCPLFERYDVDIVFSGHEHLYERTWPIRDFLPGGPGIVYVTEGGGGGSPLSTFVADPETAFVASKHGYVVVRVDGDTLALQAHDENGVVLDAATIEKPAALPPAQPRKARRHVGPA